MAIEGSSIWSDTSEREQTRTSRSPETKHPTILPLILHHPSPYSTIESILFAEHLTPLHLQTHVNGQLFQGGVGDRVKHWDGVRCQVDPGFGDCYKVGGTKLLHIAWLKRLRHPSPLKKNHWSSWGSLLFGLYGWTNYEPSDCWGWNLKNII